MHKGIFLNVFCAFCAFLWLIVKRLEVSACLRICRREKSFGSFEQNEFALVHQGDAFAENQRLAYIVSDDDGGLAETRGQIGELFLQTRAREWIERAERLVKQEQRRVCCECTCNADALALTA